MLSHQQQRASTRRFRPFALLAFTLVAALAVPANALPGQSARQLLAWLKHPELSVNLEKGTDEESGWVKYHVLNGDHGITWDFTALMDATGHVREEIFKLPTGTNDETMPIHRDGSGYGFSTMQWLLGKDVAADFKDAKPIAPFPKAGDKTAQRYFRGKRFAWISDAGGGQLHLLTFHWLTVRLKADAACAKIKGGCDP